MKESAKESRKQYMRAYMKKWRVKNKDKIKAYNERYWEKKSAEAKQHNKIQNQNSYIKTYSLFDIFNFPIGSVFSDITYSLDDTSEIKVLLSEYSCCDTTFKALGYKVDCKDTNEEYEILEMNDTLINNKFLFKGIEVDYSFIKKLDDDELISVENPYIDILKTGVYMSKEYLFYTIKHMCLDKGFDFSEIILSSRWFIKTKN